MLRQAIIAAAATLLTLGAAAGARADASAKTANTNSGWNTNFSDPQTLGSWGAQPDHKTLQFSDKGKWGLKLDMEKPIGRDMDWKDVRAGAYSVVVVPFDPRDPVPQAQRDRWTEPVLAAFARARTVETYPSGWRVLRW